MENEKSPGIDSLPIEFYKSQYEVIKTDLLHTLHIKWSFPLRISAVFCGFSHIYWRNPQWKTFFVQWYLKLYLFLNENLPPSMTQAIFTPIPKNNKKELLKNWDQSPYSV